MNKKTMVIKAAECAVKEMLLKRSSSCLIYETIGDNNAKLHNIRWDDVLIGLIELESEDNDDDRKRN